MLAEKGTRSSSIRCQKDNRLEIWNGSPPSKRTSRVILPIHDNTGISGRHTKADQIDVSVIRKRLDVYGELHVETQWYSLIQD